MPFPFIHYFNSLWIIIAIIMTLLILISISSYQFFIDNSNKINNIALQNIRDNLELQAEELATSLTNKIEAVTSNMEIIRDAPLI